MNIMITGASGMIGSMLVQALLKQEQYNLIGVDRSLSRVQHERYKHIRMDLADQKGLEKVFEMYPIDRVIHLAGLAHENSGIAMTWENYKRINVINAENVFRAASDFKCPILFSSTVDVFGYADGRVDGKTKPAPVSLYGKSKAIAEKRLMKICRESNNVGTIYRFSPVYTAEQKRDIQKRYYLRYPDIAYQIGQGSYYEVLSMENLIHAVEGWLSSVPEREIRIIRDPDLLDTKECIRQEREKGRAKVVLRMPRLPLMFFYKIAHPLFRKFPQFYLLYKALYPYRSVKSNPKVLFISSSGGHYEQLNMLKPVMEEFDSRVITEQVPGAGKADYYMVQISHTDKGILFKFAYDMIRAAVIWKKEKPDYIVSTGSMIVIPFAILAKLTRKKIIYIETFAVRTKPTLTGQFMYKWADLFIVQWESLLEVFPNAVYGGSIY